MLCFLLDAQGHLIFGVLVLGILEVIVFGSKLSKFLHAFLLLDNTAYMLALGLMPSSIIANVKKSER